jgi:hypothetical protein
MFNNPLQWELLFYRRYTLPSANRISLTKTPTTKNRARLV